MTSITSAALGLTWRGDDEIVQLRAWGAHGIRVRAARGSTLPEPLGDDGALLEVATPEPAIEQAGAGAVLRNGDISAEIGRHGAIRFCRSRDGEELLVEADRHFVDPRARHYVPRPDGYWRIEATFAGYPGERFYGLGQQQHGRLDQRGCVIDLVQRNTQVAIPFLLSSRGYGLLWHSPASGRVELAADATRWVADAARGIDYWITAAETPAAILERYTAVTGRAPMLPERAAGFWQSNLRYRSQDEVMRVAHEYRRRGLPLDVIVIDAGHWTLMGDWRFDEQLWPDPGAMVRELDAMGVQVIVSVWPTVNERSPNAAILRQAGLLARTSYGDEHPTWLFDNEPPGVVPLHLLDATHPDARAFLGERLLAGYVRHGITWFWLDADEPEIKPLDPARVHYHAGPGEAVHDLYPHLHARGVHETLQRAGVDGAMTLNRSLWAGSQRYAAALWSGDIHSSWAALRAQLPAGLNAGMSGIPWWGSDIGGFKGGVSADPDFRELLVRWFQFAVFTPLFRLHGLRVGGDPADDGRADERADERADAADFEDLTELAEGASDAAGFSLAHFSGGPNEVWSFGEAAYECIVPLLHLRRRMRPYLLDRMREAHDRGVPPMRALLLEFPDDPVAWDVADQFCLGPDLLVAPVLEPAAREREVYLPRGATWRDGWTGERREAGRRHRVAAPLERIPVFVRDEADVSYLRG